MPIPELDPFGLLPRGIHDCTVDEIGDHFGGSSDCHRRDLFNEFLRWRSALMRHNLPIEIYFDGGFTTNKERPKDIDIALRLPPPDREILKRLARATDVLDPEIVGVRYPIDLLVFRDTEFGPDPMDYVDFLCHMRPEDARRHGVPASHVRGILRVRP